MPRTVTFEDLIGENALSVVGTVQRLLRQLDREVGTDHAKTYAEEAMAGSYENLLRVSHRYAYNFLASTLHVEKDFESYEDALDEAGVEV